MSTRVTIEFPDSVVKVLERRAEAHNGSVDTEAAALVMKALATDNEERAKLIDEISRKRRLNPPLPEGFDIDEAINEGHK